MTGRKLFGFFEGITIWMMILVIPVVTLLGLVGFIGLLLGVLGGACDAHAGCHPGSGRHFWSPRGPRSSLRAQRWAPVTRWLSMIACAIATMAAERGRG